MSFVNGLTQATAQIGELIGTEPARTAALYEAFLAGCVAKVEEVDDSSGSLDMFAGLFCGWAPVAARGGLGSRADGGPPAGMDGR